MVVSVSDILGAQAGLQKLSNAEMPAQICFRVMKVLDAIEKEYSIIQKTYSELVNKYGSKDNEGRVMIPPERREQFNNEAAALQSEIVELNVLPIPLEALDGITFTPALMHSIQKFIEKKGEE